MPLTMFLIKIALTVQVLYEFWNCFFYFCEKYHLDFIFPQSPTLFPLHNGNNCYRFLTCTSRKMFYLFTNTVLFIYQCSFKTIYTEDTLSSPLFSFSLKIYFIYK